VQVLGDSFTAVATALSLFAGDSTFAAGANECVVQSKSASKSQTVPLVGDPLIESMESKTKELSISHHQTEETTEQLQAEELSVSDHRSDETTEQPGL
jgi:hypothetical protein